jgi:hypothetical protein
MPVNYWDYLGWKDTLARNVFTERQRAYAATRGDHEIYTPQLIVNGMVHVVGSRKKHIEKALRRTNEALRKAWVPIILRLEGTSLLSEVGAVPENSGLQSGVLWVAFFSRSVTVDIRRGENSGRRITYTNVVRDLRTAGQWDGAPAQFRVPLPRAASINGCAVFLQVDETNAIIGAASMRIPRGYTKRLK